MARKLTKQEVMEAATKVLEYDAKMQALQDEYSQYRRVFGLTKTSTINKEDEMTYPIQRHVQCTNKEAQELSADVCKYAFINDPELAFNHIVRNRYCFMKNDRVCKYKDACLEGLMKHPNIMFDLFYYHVVAYQLNHDNFHFSDNELDMIWNNHGNFYLNKVKNTVIDFYLLFNTFPHKFSYENKKLLVKRIIGRNKQYEASKLMKSKYLPEDLVGQLDGYLILQKLI